MLIELIITRHQQYIIEFIISNYSLSYRIVIWTYFTFAVYETDIASTTFLVGLLIVYLLPPDVSHVSNI